MDPPTAGAASPTYQCVVCQSTCLTPNELHRHQSYRHTPEELSLSIIGVHNAAIRTFDLPNGIVYDNSWLYDPNRHAAFYTYSANMLCDDNNNGDVVDYAFKTFEDRVVEESGPAAVPDDEDCTDDVDRCVDEKYENENFVEARNFEQESWVGESKILDLRVKIDLEVETETRMDTARDNFWGFCEAHSGDGENLERDDKQSASSDRRPIKTCMQSLNFEELQTCVPDGLASKILDLGRKVFSEVQPATRTDDAADNFGNNSEGLHSDSGNLGRDIGEKSQNRQNETCVKVQHFDKQQTCVQDSEILDLSQKFCSDVQPKIRMDTAVDNLWKRYKEIRSDIDPSDPRGETAKRRSAPSECPAKSKARKLTTPRKKLDSLKRGAAKPENTENRESGNVDVVKWESQESQDSLSWFESEASKIKRYNDKVKQIRASQKKALNLTKVARKQVKAEGSGKAKKRTMQSCGSGDAVQLSRNFDCEDLLGFDGKGATISATCSRNAKRPRISKKKGKICETEADKSAEETAELPKKPLDEETAGEAGITAIRAEHSSTFGSDQSLIKIKSKKSKIHSLTAGKAEKARVSKKKGKISEIEADNSAALPKREPEEETAGETEITLHSAEHSSIIGSDQFLFNLESGKSKIRATTSGNAKKPRVSKKKGKICEIEADNSARLPKREPEEETAGETEITLHSAEHSSIIGSDQFLFNLESGKSQIHAKTSGNAKKPRVSKKKGKIAETEADNTAGLLKRPPKEETAGEAGITQIRAEHSLTFDSDQSLFNFKSKKSKIHTPNAGKAKKLSESWKKGKIGKTEAANSAELPKRPSEEETAGETEITLNSAEHNSIIGSDQSSFNLESSKSKNRPTTSGNTKKPRVSKKKGKISESEVDNSAQLPKRLPEEETAGETEITQHRAEHSSTFDSDQSSFNLESSKSKIRPTTSGNAKKPRVSKKKGKISESEVDNSAELPKRLPEEETAGETEITQHRAEHSSTFDSDQSLLNLESSKSKIRPTTSGNAKKPRVSKKKRKISGTEADNSADETADLLKKLLEEETAGETLITQNQDKGDENCGKGSSIFSSDKYSSHSESKKLKVHATTSGSAKKPRVSRKKEYISDTETDNSANETAELLKKLLEEETAGETQITQNQDNGNGNPAESSLIFASAESTFHFESKEAKIDMASSINAKNPIASKNLETAAEEPAEQESTKPAHQDCAKEVGPRPNWDWKSEDSTACLDEDRPKINVMCAENAEGQAEKTAADEPVKHASILEIDNAAEQNCAQEVGLQDNWDCKSEDLPACLDAGPVINAACAENAGVQAEETAADEPVKPESSLQIENAADQNCAQEVGLQANWDVASEDFSTCLHTGPKINATCAENAGVQAEKTAADESANQESIVEIENGADRNCAKEVELQASWNFKSEDSPTCLDAGQKINATCAENAGVQAEKTAADKPANQESIVEIENGADQNCAKEVELQASWNFKSEDSPTCLDAEPKINATCVENAGVQAEKTAADESANQESIVETEKGANRNCANEARFQPNWDFESADLLACSDGDGQKINPMHAGNAGAQTENTAIEETGELLKDLLTEPSEEETPQGAEKLQNQDYENGNYAEQSLIFSSSDSGVRLESKEANIGAKKPITSTRKAQNPKTEADKPTKRETTKPANQKSAKEIRPRLNWDFESADFLACSDGDGQKINATRAENDAAQGEKAAVEVTAELLRDLLSQPTEEETPRMTEKLQNEDYGDEDYAGEGSFFSSDEYLYYFPSEEAKMAAMSSGYAKKPINYVNKSNTLKTVTVGPARQKMTRKIVNDGNGNSSKQSSRSSRDVFSYTDSSSEGAVITPPVASGKKSNFKPVIVWTANQKMTRKIVNDGNGNSSKQSSGSSRNVFSYTGSASEGATVMPPITSGKKSNLKIVNVWAAKQKMTRKIVNDGNGNLSKQSSGSSRDVFSYTGGESEEATITPLIASGKKSNLKTVNVWGAKQKMTRKIVNDGSGNSSKQSSGSSRDVFSYTGGESEEASITPLIASGKKSNLKTVNVWGAKHKMTRKIVNDESGNSSKQSSGSSRDVFSYTGSESDEVTITPISKFRAERSSALGNCAGHSSNFVPNYTCTDRANKQVAINVPFAAEPKKRQVVKETARGTTKLFYQDFGSEISVSQTSPPIIDVNSSTESGSEEEMPKNPPAGNFRKSIFARNKPKNLKTPEVEPAPLENSENPEHDNVISLYKDSTLIPSGSSACDNELPPVTFVAYPPYVDENSILVLNPESRELVWKSLETEDSQLDEPTNFRWVDRGSQRDFSETGKASTSRNVGGEKTASFVPAAIGAPASNEESTLQKTNVRRSTRPRKTIQRYNS